MKKYILKLPLLYPVYFCTNKYKNIITEIIKNLDSANIILITDNKVRNLYANELFQQFKENQKYIKLLSFPSGEKYKNISTVMKFVSDIYKMRVSKYDTIVGIGGGVVLNLAGFVASVICRGLKLYYIPTTVLAQCDVCIGPKTGFNFNGINNFISSSFRPNAVIVDNYFLRTLSEDEKANGLCECIKHALCQDDNLLRLIVNNNKKIIFSDLFLQKVIKRTLILKSYILSKDENEDNFGSLLRYGHVIGNALEYLTENEIPHGKAISIGIVVEAEIAKRLGFLSADDLLVHKKILSKVGLPIKIPKHISIEDVLSALRYDKYKKKGINYFFLLNSLSRPKDINGQFKIPVDIDIVKEALHRCY